MKFPLFLTSLLAAVPISANAQAIDTKHEPVELNFRYQAGKSYVSKMINTSSSKVMVEGQNMGTDQTMTMDFTIKVDAIEGSENVKSTITYDRISMKMTTMGQEMNFDSAKPETLNGNPLGSMATMAGKSLTATITPEMEFIDLKGVDKLFEGLGEGAEMARAMFSDEQLKQMMGSQVIAMMPKKKVKSGDEWPYKVTTPMGPLGNMMMEGTSAMKGVLTKDESKFAVVAYTAKVKSKAGDEPGQLGMAMEIKDGKMESSYHFDLTEGYVTESTTKMSMTILMNAPGQEQKLSIPSNSTVTITTKMK